MLNRPRLRTKVTIMAATLLLVVGLSMGYIAHRTMGTMGNGLTEDLLSLKIEDDIRLAEMYLRDYYGFIVRKDNHLIDDNGHKINDDLKMVDAIKEDLGWAATLLVLEGEDFTTIATNILNDRGERIPGTSVGIKGAVYQSMIQKRPYLGDETILGLPYLCAYIPILDNNNDLIGILFIGVPRSEINARTDARLTDLSFGMAGAFTGIILLGIIVLSLCLNRLVAPFPGMIDVIKRLALGELTIRLPVKGNDEIGGLAKDLNAFIERIQCLIKDLAQDTADLGLSSDSLSRVSSEMSRGTGNMSLKSGIVAAASGEMSSSMSAISSSMETASENLDLVAVSAQELNATINEIAKNAENARKITGNAVSLADSAIEKVAELGMSASEIGNVSAAIMDISEQTNLLALNATIEAARAGEAGKGFAVVANEIKELAKQASDATEKIKSRIKSIQKDTAETIGGIDQISQVINDVNEIIGAIATAVEEQSFTTREIAGNVSQASKGIREVNENIAQSTRVSGKIVGDISEVRGILGDMNAAGQDVGNSAYELNRLMERLSMILARFKV